ncbi:hypothetical protein NE237_026496 [Protea cynaroides]|uniref:Uncharacterized protein n=1 Tax=Protea cynaroides TaxID=273540 RepID=A0A9Q0H514_9MAGN|nr:hypothetical protein NE237_026496 [Protea cynaroides]
MEKGESSMAENEDSGETTTPAGLTQEEFKELKPVIQEFHTYRIRTGKCSSLLAQRICAPAETVWSIVCRFDKPQIYKHFIKSCSIKESFSPTTVGCLREVNVISGLPAETSTERLDLLDDERRVTGFTIIGGEHRLRNYQSVTSVTEFKEDKHKHRNRIELGKLPEGTTTKVPRLRRLWGMESMFLGKN